MAGPAIACVPALHRSERQLQRLRWARECALWGARQRTIEIVTGLNHRQVLRLLHAESRVPPRGRPPDTPEWYHGGTLLDRTEACVFATCYQRLRALDFEPARALLGAYRHYRGVCWHTPRLSFDRGFDLARHLDGIWNAKEACFSLAACADCASSHLTEPGTGDYRRHDCPFCKLLTRYARDPRVQTHFPTPPLPDPVCLRWGLALRANMVMSAAPRQ